MSNRILIGINGQKGVGKSTAAEYLSRNYDFKEFAFADPLKEACIIIFGLERHQVYGTQKDKETIDPYWGVSPRVIMQEFGSAIREIEKQCPSLAKIWIRNVERQIAKSPHNKFVISDVRHIDESAFVRDWYIDFKDRGQVIKIIRDSVENSDSHESETQQIDADLIITNNETKKELYAELDVIVKIFDINNSK